MAYGPTRRDLTGQRYGRWLVLSYSHSAKQQVHWLCRCDCGTEKTTQGRFLTAGQSESCGCLVRERIRAANLKHGQSQSTNQKATPEYLAWTAMIFRCENPHYRGYHRYGGRGITVCERWRGSFENFLADMGQRTGPKHSLDRYDNDGHYTPGNCRWATKKEQANNRLNPWTTRRQNNALRSEIARRTDGDGSGV